MRHDVDAPCGLSPEEVGQAVKDARGGAYVSVEAQGSGQGDAREAPGTIIYTI